MSKVISLVALAAAAHVHAVERDAAGDIISGAAVRFVSSDETLFTVTPNEADAMAADLRGLREGSGVLSVFDAHTDTLHVSYDVHVAPAVATEIELDGDDGKEVGTDEAPAVAVEDAAQAPEAAPAPVASLGDSAA